MPQTVVPDPDLVRVQTRPEGAWTAPDRSGVGVDLVRSGAGLAVLVSPGVPVSRVHLRWRTAVPGDALVLGDAWERSYGELEWHGVRAERALPWTVLVHSPGSGATDAWGVEVRGGAFAFWTVDVDGIGLWLDVRCGGQAVAARDRVIRAAVVRRVGGEASAFATQAALAALQCTDPLPVPRPLVGANNWYYAYGRGFGPDAVLRDARMIVDLSPDGARPFAVIDDGWSEGGVADGRPASGGPWDAGRAASFPDMPGIAARIAAEGAEPGIWYRPLLRRAAPPSGDRGERQGAVAVDPTDPGIAAIVADDVARLADWGFTLIKHDFSTFDLLGRWGWNMGASPAGDSPALADPTRTTAEALVGFYRILHEASGSSAVLGCDVVGHLAAGLVTAQRTGDDTSGRDWDRTRRVGVNTLAFRLAQHGRFFAVDADCVPSTPETDWAFNRRFLDLVARSGTVLFVSVDPRTRSDRVDADLADALALAFAGGDPGGVEPLDWMHSPTPHVWRTGAGTTRYDWEAAVGADPFERVETAEP